MDFPVNLSQYYYTTIENVTSNMACFTLEAWSVIFEGNIVGVNFWSKYINMIWTKMFIYILHQWRHQTIYKSLFDFKY